MANIDVKLLILGTREVGKSSYVLYTKSQTFNDKYVHTYDSIETCNTIKRNDTTYLVGLTDTNGDDYYFKYISKSVIRQIRGAIFMYNVNDMSSFEKFDSMKKDLFATNAIAFPDKFPIIVIGNKSDLEKNVPDDLLDIWCTENNAKARFEMSLKLGTVKDCSSGESFKVDQLVEKLIDLCLTYEVPKDNNDNKDVDDCGYEEDDEDAVKLIKHQKKMNEQIIEKFEKCNATRNESLQELVKKRSEKNEELLAKLKENVVPDQDVFMPTKVSQPKSGGKEDNPCTQQ